MFGPFRKHQLLSLLFSGVHMFLTLAHIFSTPLVIVDHHACYTDMSKFHNEDLHFSRIYRHCSTGVFHNGFLIKEVTLSWKLHWVLKPWLPEHPLPFYQLWTPWPFSCMMHAELSLLFIDWPNICRANVCYFILGSSERDCYHSNKGILWLLLYRVIEMLL